MIQGDSGDGKEKKNAKTYHGKVDVQPPGYGGSFPLKMGHLLFQKWINQIPLNGGLLQRHLLAKLYRGGFHFNISLKRFVEWFFGDFEFGLH